MAFKRVFIDIGHGSDTYATGGGKGVVNPDGSLFQEHQFNSDVAIAAKQLLNAQGIYVDFGKQNPHSPEVDLVPRTNYINAVHASKPYDCCISIHANAAGSQASGYGVFYWEGDAPSKRLAQIWKKYMDIVTDIEPWGGINGTGLWESKWDSWTNFHMTREPDPPAILLEHFFFTNYAEQKKCNTPAYHKKFGEVIARTVCEYIGIPYKEEEKVEKKEKPIPTTPSSWAIKSIDRLKKIGITDGKRPRHFITREEVMVMIDRALDYIDKDIKVVEASIDLILLRLHELEKKEGKE